MEDTKDIKDNPSVVEDNYIEEEGTLDVNKFIELLLNL